MAASTPCSWTTAPAEVRLQILENLLPSTKSRAESVTRYACVCAEWQHFFESFTFRRILLDNHSVRHFIKVTHGKNVARLSYIRYLELCIKLRRHDPPHSYSPENYMTKAQNNRTFSIALKRLFQALSRWIPRDEWDQGLILEITSSSPSDAKSDYHSWLDNEMHQQFRLPQDLDISSITDYLYEKYKEPRTLRTDRRWGYAWAHPARICGTPLEFVSKEDPHQVPIVHTLWIRKQFYRGVAFASLVALLQKSLTRVSSLRYERWIRFYLPEEEELFPKGLQSLILGLPSTIQSFSFNQWDRVWMCNDILHRRYGSWNLSSKGMAAKAHDLVRYCPPWQINIWNFLEELRQPLPSTSESKLKRLCLQHNDLNFPVRQQEITLLLKEVALSMPSLRNLELLEVWGTANSYGFLFRYEQFDRRATMTWKSNSNEILLDVATIEQWTNVTAARDMKLAIEEEMFSQLDEDGHDVESGKLMYEHLKLRDLVIDPVTLAFFKASKF